VARFVPEYLGLQRSSVSSLGPRFAVFPEWLSIGGSYAASLAPTARVAAEPLPSDPQRGSPSGLEAIDPALGIALSGSFSGDSQDRFGIALGLDDGYGDQFPAMRPLCLFFLARFGIGSLSKWAWGDWWSGRPGGRAVFSGSGGHRDDLDQVAIMQTSGA
jgi:hypothetical protein